MAPTDLIIAQRYAQALFELAQFLHKDEEIGEELGAFAAALKLDASLGKLFLNPRVKRAEKRSLLERIYQGRDHEIYGHLLNFFTILLEKGRFNLIQEIAVSFKRIADEAHGRGTAEIASAAPLDAEAERAIVEKLEKWAGYKIEVKKTVDPALIGGVVVRIKNKGLDGSVLHQIRTLKKELIKVRSI